MNSSDDQPAVIRAITPEKLIATLPGAAVLLFVAAIIVACLSATHTWDGTVAIVLGGMGSGCVIGLSAAVSAAASKRAEHESKKNASRVTRSEIRHETNLLYSDLSSEIRAINQRAQSCQEIAAHIDEIITEDVEVHVFKKVRFEDRTERVLEKQFKDTTKMEYPLSHSQWGRIRSLLRALKECYLQPPIQKIQDCSLETDGFDGVIISFHGSLPMCMEAVASYFDSSRVQVQSRYLEKMNYLVQAALEASATFNEVEPQAWDRLVSDTMERHKTLGNLLAL